jgi:hypothetical protein
LAAFEELVSRFGEQAYRVAYRLTGNHDDALDLIQEALLEAFRDCGTVPSLASLDDDRRQFSELADEWRATRRRWADVQEMVSHPAYQRIIGMGERAVPFLLGELSTAPNHWFWALHAITGENPVPAESEGRLHDMAAAWIDWGKRQGYQWSTG